MARGERHLHVGGDNVGAMIAGDVYAHQLLFNINGETRTAADLSVDELLALKKSLRRLRHRRDFFASMPTALWLTPTFFLLVATLQLFAPRTGADLLRVLATVGLFSMVFWVWVRSLVGSSARIQRGIAAQLEERLVLVQLELDLRNASPERWPWRRLWTEWRDVIKD